MPSDSVSAWLQDIVDNIDLRERVRRRHDIADVRGRPADALCSHEMPRDHFRGITATAGLREAATSGDSLAGDRRSGNIYRHDYEDVAAGRIWQTVKSSLAPLRVAMVRELEALDDGQT
jgi:hypothetical protein